MWKPWPMDEFPILYIYIIDVSLPQSTFSTNFSSRRSNQLPARDAMPSRWSVHQPQEQMRYLGRLRLGRAQGTCCFFVGVSQGRWLVKMGKHAVSNMNHGCYDLTQTYVLHWWKGSTGLSENGAYWPLFRRKIRINGTRVSMVSKKSKSKSQRFFGDPSIPPHGRDHGDFTHFWVRGSCDAQHPMSQNRKGKCGRKAFFGWLKFYGFL